jgi:hypothetical protein
VLVRAPMRVRAPTHAAAASATAAIPSRTQVARRRLAVRLGQRRIETLERERDLGVAMGGG